jgi:hypothetical protein
VNAYDELLDRALLHEITAIWDTANHGWFRRALRRPVFRLVETATVFGTWHRETRTISVNRRFAREAPWPQVREVVLHEIAHQYAHEVLGATDETHHGPAFRAACEKMGLDPRASGAPAGVDGPEVAILRKLRKLLALADSPNQHEAEAAMKAAQRLMLQYNLDLGARHASAGYRVKHFGAPRARQPGWHKLLVGLLAEHFFVHVVWVQTVDRSGEPPFKPGWVPEIMGTPENLEFAEYVYHFLIDTSERLWRGHKRAQRLTGDRERQRFLAGVMVGFRRKLHENLATCRSEGLVWVGDPGLEDFERRRHPRLVSGAAISLSATEGFHAGQAAGREIVLHKPIESAPTGRTLLLP